MAKKGFMVGLSVLLLTFVGGIVYAASGTLRPGFYRCDDEKTTIPWLYITNPDSSGYYKVFAYTSKANAEADKPQWTLQAHFGYNNQLAVGSAYTFYFDDDGNFRWGSRTGRLYRAMN